MGLRNDFWIGVFFSYQVGMGNVRVESKEASMRKCQNAKISAVSMFDTYWTQICWGHTYACLDETHTHTHTYKYIFGHSWNSPETRSWHSEVKIWRWILITQQNLNHWSSYSNQIKEARVCHFGWCTWLGFVWTQMHTRPSTIFCSSIWSEMIRNRTQYGSDLVRNGLKLDLIWAKILYKKKNK